MSTITNQANFFQISFHAIRKKSLITTIQDLSGKCTQSPQEINHIFYTYYQNLYSAADNPIPEDIQAFLNNLYLPQLSTEHKTLLDTPLTINELQSALDSMPLGKAPGLNL